MQPGTRLDHCTVTEAIGAGGMGEVVRARDDKPGRDVALEILPAAAAAEPRFEALLRRIGLGAS